MARSALFSALQRILRKASRDDAAPAGPSRRDVLAGLAAAAALPVVPALSGCGDNDGASASTIAVIGGGIAGLTAAHFLAQTGAKVTVYESSMRTGGRMWTDRRASLGGQLVELGGELVDTDHVVVPALCQAFGLTLDDLIEDTSGLRQDTFYFAGRVLTDAELVAAFTPVAAQMRLALAAAEGEDAASVAEFERIDAMSIPRYLEDECGLAEDALIRRVLEVSYLEEYGLEVSMQSAWNLLYLIDAMTPDPFRVFGDSDERFHIHEGNDALPTKLADALGGERIALDHKLTRVIADGDGFILTFATSAGEVSVTAGHVVYALPFTRLREVDLSEAALSTEKLEVIDELGYGTNAKLMMQFRGRPWQSQHQAGGGAITDVGQLQTIWATSRGQAGAAGILTNFVGGARGVAMGQGTPESQATTVLPWIDTVFPGTSTEYLTGSAIRQHWPSYEHVKGSYGCYTVGQWRFFGTEGAREGNQHFCGEHCSEDFQGYMEGGAETGVMVAAEIMDDLGLEKPAMLVSLLDLVTSARPRASYHRGFGERMHPRQIRRRRRR